LELQTNIPKPSIFRYENNWRFKEDSRNLVSNCWTQNRSSSNAAACLVSVLKNIRKQASQRKKHLKPDRLHLNCAKRCLTVIDWIEDQRHLSHLESTFRSLLKKKKEELIHSVAVAARQRGKITWCVLGDEDTNFYHARASIRLRSNQIKVVEQDGQRFFYHKDKEQILTNSYKNLLGAPATTSISIDLHSLYPSTRDLSSLTLPFSEADFYNAVKSVPRDKSPGPDGFGSGFYQSFWSLVKQDILSVFQEFCHGTLELDRLNRSYMVLIKKKRECCTPDSYRPISLLNCTVKFITKILASRLQHEIKSLVDQDQSGFVRKRCIADNFMYAADIIQCCKQRKRKVIILKLDFTKAFDTIS
jgi:hypothetical protein